MKLIITGDLHSRKDDLYSEFAISYLEFLFEYAKKSKIDTIVFDGDIFDKSTRIHNETFIPVFKLLYENKDNFRFYFILGNHDIYSIDNDSIVETFAPIGPVIKENQQFEIGGIKIDMLAYTKNTSDLIYSEKTGGDILITHLAIANFSFDNSYHVNEKIAFTPDLFSGYRKVFSGHFHKFQENKNIVYVGSPFQQNFGETGEEKGFVVLETDDLSWTFEKYKFAPVYKKENIEDLLTKEYPSKYFYNTFLQVEIKQKVDNFVKLKHVLYERGVIKIVPKFIKEEVGINHEDGKDVEINQSLENMVVSFIKEKVSEEGIDNEKLIKIFSTAYKNTL